MIFFKAGIWPETLPGTGNLGTWETETHSEEIYKVIHSLNTHFPDVQQKTVRKGLKSSSSKLRSERLSHSLPFVSVLLCVDTP